jgi:ArsR family transcriptional regulator
MENLNNKLEVLRVISHPVRIRILEELLKDVKCVSDFEEFLDISQPNVSQHLSLMRKMGVIDYYVDGRLRCYFLVDSMVSDLLKLLRKDHSEPLRPPACCPVTKKGKYPANKMCA